MSVGSKAGGGSRASDEDGRTSVKVGEFLSSESQLLATIRSSDLASKFFFSFGKE